MYPLSSHFSELLLTGSFSDLDVQPFHLKIQLYPFISFQLPSIVVILLCDLKSL